MVFAGRILIGQFLHMGHQIVDAPSYYHSNRTVDVFYVLGSLIISPIAEEFFYRGILLSGLLKRYGMWWAILITALLYSLTHIPGNSFPTYVLGVFTGWLVIRTGSIYSAIVAHFIFNLVVVISRIGVLDGLSGSLEGFLLYRWSAVVICGVTFAVGLVVWRKKLSLEALVQ